MYLVKKKKYKDIWYICLFSAYLEQPILEAPTIKEPWKAEFIEDIDCKFSLDNGVYQVIHTSKESAASQNPDNRYPPLSEFVSDMQLMCAMIANGPL